ncbi:MAG: G5 domain-containing protein [Oscillibacter sp.]
MIGTQREDDQRAPCPSTTPHETVYEDDPTLAPGTEKVKTTPYTGYKYRTYRNVYDANGKLISSTYEGPPATTSPGNKRDPPGPGGRARRRRRRPDSQRTPPSPPRRWSPRSSPGP